MTDEPQLVRLERRDDGVAVVTLDNPKVNALSRALLAKLHHVAVELSADPPGAVVVSGGDRIFAAGANISEFVAARGEDHHQGVPRLPGCARRDPALRDRRGERLRARGGCELALACDTASPASGGVRPTRDPARDHPRRGGTQRLPRIVGPRGRRR